MEVINMKITLKDGSVKEYANAMSVIDIAKDLSEGLARVACAGEIDGKVIHSGFITAMLTIWIGALPFVPDLKYYIADGVIACFLYAGAILLVSYMRTQKKKEGIKPELIKLVAVYLLYMGLIKGTVALVVTFLITKILKTENIVPVMSICTIICLCVGEIVLGANATSYINTLIETIRVF